MTPEETTPGPNANPATTDAPVPTPEPSTLKFYALANVSAEGVVIPYLTDEGQWIQAPTLKEIKEKRKAQDDPSCITILKCDILKTLGFIVPLKEPKEP